MSRERRDQHAMVDRRDRVAGKHPFGAQKESEVHRRCL
jgi:hypothetical protein